MRKLQIRKNIIKVIRGLEKLFLGYLTKLRHSDNNNV